MSLENLQNAESTLDQKSDQLLNSYEEAIILIQKGNLVEAVNALNNFVTNNQDDEQTPLAYFWLGELNLSQNNLALSIQNFNTLIGLYPAHWRVPLAKYKLGAIYLEQGNTNRAKTQFEFVIAEYPDSSAAKASRESLDSLE
jgi:tol-pal system protein YbgF